MTNRRDGVGNPGARRRRKFDVSHVSGVSHSKDASEVVCFSCVIMMLHYLPFFTSTRMGAKKTCMIWDTYYRSFMEMLLYTIYSYLCIPLLNSSDIHFHPTNKVPEKKETRYYN